jgi:hypothetical protein
LKIAGAISKVCEVVGEVGILTSNGGTWLSRTYDARNVSEGKRAAFISLICACELCTFISDACSDLLFTMPISTAFSMLNDIFCWADAAPDRDRSKAAVTILLLFIIRYMRKN